MSFRFFVPASRRAAHGAGWLALAVALQGCSADIMRGYVGRPPEAVMARYGPPVDVRDLPDGRRAYQWMEVETTTSGGSETTTYERGRRRTEYAPTTTAEKRCFYTFYAHRTSAGWRIDSYLNPELGC
ncbi:hypothetical protein ACQKOH_20215 [Sphingomonas sp. NPDC092331]|uniref:hypothetical protein n=1 Tax=unclassified Sphingomonas TaxID=196159 RepID=UPI0029F42D42|nr:hypothetical protein [Pseudomonadota bacterium]